MHYFYPSGSKLMIVEMRGKSFPVEWKQFLRVFPSRFEEKFSALKRELWMTIMLDVILLC